MACRIKTLGATVIVVLLAAAPATAAVTEFPVGSAPSELTGGLGAVWASSPSAPGSVIEVARDGTATHFTAGTTGGFTGDRTPQGIAVGPDGNLWVAEKAGSLLRLTPDGGATEFSVPGGGVPVDVVAGPDGRIWYSDQGSNHAIGAMATDGTGATTYTTGLSDKAGPAGIVAGPDGNLWFAETSAAKIGRITPAGVITEFPVGAGHAPGAITVGPDGALWFTETGSAAGIGRITTAGDTTHFSSGVLPGTPAGITTGSDGALWFTIGDAVGRLTTSGDMTSSSLTPAQAPKGITSGPDGAIWLAESTSPGHVARVSVPPLAGATTAAGTTLTATVQPNGSATTYHFEYGPDGQPALTTPDAGAGDGASAVTVTASLGDLRAGTAYSARLVATNDGGTATGEPAHFSTPAATAAPVLAPPVVAQSVGLSAESGVVRVRVPGATSSVALSDASTLPVGSVIDTTKGTVRLETALPGGRTQSGLFHGGIFMVRQHNNGMTDLLLRGSSFAGCRARAKLASAASVRKRHRVVRSLWGADHHGQFRTYGRNSVASVRGTRWLTQDRCDGTLTKVTSGAVDVLPRGAKRAVRVRAGHSYLARR